MGNKYICDGILKTICYADIFDYPLRLWEVWHFFIGNTPVLQQAIEKEIKNMPLLYIHGFYCFKNRKQIIAKRINSDKYTVEKYKIAKRICSIPAYIPTILLIGVSGGLAMGNVAEDDDIDLFIIARNNTLWITRLLTLLILGIMGVQRRKKDIAVSNKICLNMMVTVDGMVIPDKKQNLFIAHEVLQMKPLFVRGDTYKQFLEANRWIAKFLPNVIPAEAGIQKYIHIDSHLHGNDKMNMFEFIAKKLQFWYMKQHITSEVVSDTILAFHPNDYTHSVIKKYHRKVKRYGKI